MSEDKRKAKRIKEETQVTITLLSKDAMDPGKKLSYHLTKDISSVGLKILTNTFLPISSMLKIELALSKPPKLIIAFGKVRWVKSRYADELFEIGIEFADTPPDVIKALHEHIEKAAETLPFA
jgi:hypothetical protein